VRTAPAPWHVMLATAFVVSLLSVSGATAQNRISPPNAPRPQDVQHPVPYRAEEIRIETRDGVVLAGTLSLPEGRGPFPAVFLASGSGQQDRDYSNFPWRHKTFGVLADLLTRQGIAVLRLDDRGIGGSSGSYRGATNSDFVSDALSAVDFLRRHPEADSARTGILGHSWGSKVALLAAGTSPAVKYVIMLGGVGLPWADAMAAQRAAVVASNGASAEYQAAVREWFLRLQEAALSDPDSSLAVQNVQSVMEAYRPRLEAFNAPGSPPMPDSVWNQILQIQARAVVNRWYLEQLRTDPAEYMTRVKVPVLALTGSLDTSAPPENLAALSRTLHSSGNTRVTVDTVPGINHFMQTVPAGTHPDAMGEIEETVSPMLVERIVAWLTSVWP
jgi:uncharacterized protein